MSMSNLLAISSPLFPLQELSRSGSLISHFHHPVVRGFSRYTLIIMCKFGYFAFKLSKYLAYSFASSTLCIEQGQTKTTILGSLKFMILLMISLLFAINLAVSFFNGIFVINSAGVTNSLILFILVSSTIDRLFIRNV